MKNFRWILFFAVIAMLISPFLVLAQSPGQVIVEQGPGLFQKIGSWIQDNVLGVLITFVVGILAQHGWTLVIKRLANKGAIVTKEIGEFFTDSSNFMNVLDNAIKDDGKIDQNSVKEVLAAGKEVLAEGKDVIISIKPKNDSI